MVFQIPAFSFQQRCILGPSLVAPTIKVPPHLETPTEVASALL